MAFVALALATRAIFWGYTGRVWEDAIISSSPARNVWEGVGLTHHSSEPRVHSFTSALGEFVLIAGEGFGSGYGIAAMRIASLVAAAATIVYAARICAALQLHWLAQVLLLGYLATDHLQIFFGMSGMETQLAVALTFANAHYFLERRWVALGVATGLAIICRPEFLLWPPIVLVALAVDCWRTQRIAPIVVFAVPAALFSLPWIVFATLYYGSPIPHTIVVKSSAPLHAAKVQSLADYVRDCWAYVQDSWRHLAPFKQFVAGFREAPIPDTLLQATVALLIALSLLGAVWAIRINNRMLAILVFVASFFAYRIAARVHPYFMWYLPPFVGLLFLFAACGISQIAQRQRIVAAAAVLTLFVLYAVHLPFSLSLDRQVQKRIEEDVRLRVGERLFELMGDRDAVVLEPLGFIGWAAKNNTIYDIPGLSSPIAFAALQRQRSMSGVIAELSPTFLALRPAEWNQVAGERPDIAARYEVVSRFEAKGSSRSGSVGPATTWAMRYSRFTACANADSRCGAAAFRGADR